jgi:hypothetical protein
MKFIYKILIEMTSDDIMFVPRLMKICSGIKVILRLLPQKFETLLELALVTGGIYDACR